MKRHVLGWLCVCVALAASAVAQIDVENPDKLLLPVAPQRVPGVFGSEWLTDVAITNLSDTPLTITRDLPPTCTAQCLPLPIPPHATVFAFNIPRSSDVRGTFLFVQQGRIKDVAVTLRTRDLSRQKETWGTVLPVISSEDLFGTRFGLVDVPMEQQFRSTLRIYDFNAQTSPAVRVRFYRLDDTEFPTVSQPPADVLLLDIIPTFNLPAPGTQAIFPASVELPLWLLSELAGNKRIRIQIDPLNDSRDYWGFVSVTHNETQHVTVITPVTPK